MFSGSAHAAERPGVIEDIQPIENKGDDESEKTKIGRRLGGLAGVMAGAAANVGVIKSGVGGSGTGGTVVRSATMVGAQVAADKGQDIGAKIAGSGESVRYMVKVRLKTGRVLALTQLSDQVKHMKVGDEVLVDGRGDSATVRLAQ